MRRLAGILLVVSCLSLAGCTALLPATEPTDARNIPPQVTCEWDRASSSGTVTVRIRRGVPFTVDNTHALVVYDAQPEEVYWAGPSKHEPRGDFPVEPGDSITVGIHKSDPDLTLVWEGQDSASVTVCAQEFQVETTEVPR